MPKPLISVITVTFNAEKYIERTLLSVVNQSYPSIEYIIVDGASKDNTLSIIEGYNSKISQLVSSPDKGLYDAMNKGIDLATGDFIIFMNAGDEFESQSTIERAFLNYKNEDFVYGGTQVITEDGKIKSYHKKKPTQSEISYRSFINGMVVCHQSMFVRRSCAEKFDFSEFKLACDIDWVIRSLKNCKSFKDSGIIISRFLDGGVSQSNKKTAIRERFWICIKHFGWIATLFQQVKIGIRYILNSII